MSRILLFLAFSVAISLAIIGAAKAEPSKVSKEEARRLMSPDNMAIARYAAHRLEETGDSQQFNNIVLLENGRFFFSDSPISKKGFSLTHVFINRFDDAVQPKLFTGLLQHRDTFGRQISTLIRATYRNVKDKLLVETIATKPITLDQQRVALFFAAKSKTPNEKIAKLDTGNLLEFVSAHAVKINKGEKFNAAAPYYMFAFFLDHLGDGAKVGIVQGAAPDDATGEMMQSFVQANDGFYVAVAEVTPAFFDFKRPYLKVLRQTGPPHKNAMQIEAVVNLRKALRTP